ncbi:hypothetical protein [Dyadobacter helix]|uniref:hypothetical protein n=1 Tax=Dyadobacter helix TaxID=2822344 RepID=UPI001BFC4CA0|nr:hypothetical protein [Dyadobacter sp. CECT 9275]
MCTHDTWYHLMLAEEIRQNGYKLPSKISRFLLSESITYPPLFHVLLSCLNKRHRTAIEPFTGGLLDGLVGVCLFFIAHEWGNLGVSISVLSALLFVFSPYSLGLNFSPRATLGTPRVFGQFLFFLAVLMLLLYLDTGFYYYGSAAVVLGGLIFLSSMFSSQAFAFVLVIWSLLLVSVVPLVVLLSSYLLSLLVSRGYSWHITKGHVQHLTIMAKTFWKGRFSTQHIQQRNRLDDLLNAPRQLFTNPKQVFFLFYVRNTFLIVLFQMPVIALYIYYRFSWPEALTNVPMIHLLDTLLLSGLLVFLATSTKPFLFLGEAERYMEHVSPFCCLLIGLMLSETGYLWATYWVLIFSIGLYFVNVCLFIYQVKSKNSKERERDVESILEWINTKAPQKRFAVLPHSNLNIVIPYFTDSYVLFGQWKNSSSPAIKSLKDVESDEFRRYRSSLLQRYAIDYIITANVTPTHPNLADMKNNFPVVFQNSSYYVLFCRA